MLITRFDMVAGTNECDTQCSSNIHLHVHKSQTAHEQLPDEAHTGTVTEMVDYCVQSKISGAEDKKLRQLTFRFVYKEYDIVRLSDPCQCSSVECS